MFIRDTINNRAVTPKIAPNMPGATEIMPVVIRITAKRLSVTEAKSSPPRI
jgi:hypothetical protein